MLPKPKVYYKYIAITTVWYWWKENVSMQQDRVQRQIPVCVCVFVYSILNKGNSKSVKYTKKSLFNNK